MKTKTLEQIQRGLQYALLIFAVFYIVVYLGISFTRIQYPFELEWMEGSSVDHVRMVLSEKNLYARPSLEFVPYVYTPLYYYVSALMAQAVGVGFLPLRLVSYLASLGCLLLIFLMVRKETGCKFPAALASGLFAATFQLSGAWFDLARVDSLFLFFLLAALYMVRFSTSTKGHVLAAVLISLSYLTKQTALAISFPIMLYYILYNRRHAPFFIGTLIGIIAASTLFFDYIYDGWYSYYVFQIVRKMYHLMPHRIIEFWVTNIMAPLHIAFIMAISYLIFAKNLDSDRKSHVIYLFITVGMLGGAWSSRLHGGSFKNVLFPAYAVIAILFGLAVHMIIKFIKTTHENKQQSIKICFYLLCLIQFMCLIYKFSDQIPTEDDRKAGMMFLETMKQYEGDIFVPAHPYLPTLVGKKSHAHSWLVRDVMLDRQGWGGKLADEISQAIREKRFSAIIVDTREWRERFAEAMRQNYRKSLRIKYKDKGVFKPITGIQTRPIMVYVPAE